MGPPLRRARNAFGVEQEQIRYVLSSIDLIVPRIAEICSAVGKADEDLYKVLIGVWDSAIMTASMRTFDVYRHQKYSQQPTMSDDW